MGAQRAVVGHCSPSKPQPSRAAVRAAKQDTYAVPHCRMEGNNKTNKPMAQLLNVLKATVLSRAHNQVDKPRSCLPMINASSQTIEQ